MQAQTSHRRRASGSVRLVQRKRGGQFYAKLRLPDGRQVQRLLGPAWEGRGRTPDGYLTRRSAEAMLRQIVTDAERGTLAGLERAPNRTFGDVLDEWLRHAEHERGVKPSTLAEYTSAVNAHLRPAFGTQPISRLDARAIERWRAELVAEGRLSRRTIDKLLTILHGVCERARRLYDVPNPVADVERHPPRYSGDLDFYSPEEVMALVRAAESEQDAALYLTAAFTGLRRGELVALRWRDVDFAGEAIRVRASVTHGHLTTPKSGKVRAVPMAPQVAVTLDKLSRRDRFTGPEDLVFPGVAGDHVDGSALRRRYVVARTQAKLRPLRFHDLRHTFGSLAIDRASIVQVQEWMGHADIDTTRRYLHFKRRTNEAALLAQPFSVGTQEVAGP